MFLKFSFWHYLLLLIPVTVIASNYHFPAVITFVLASAVLVPLAHFLGEATEVISKKTGDHFSGIINATFGNAAELVIAILAIKSGLIDIVKYSLVGSIIGNILLILGLSIFVGGIKHGGLKLNPNITGTTIIHLSMAAMCFGVPSIFINEDTLLSLNKYSISIAVVLLMVYFVGMFYTIMNRESKEASQIIHEDIEATAPNWGMPKSLVVLLSTTGGLVYISEILVHQIEPLFVSPICVLIAGIFNQSFNLIFNKIELITLGMSIGGTWLVIHDNRSNWWEGFSLLSFYLIIAIAAYFL